MSVPEQSGSGRKGESPERAPPCPPGGEPPRLSHLRSIGSRAPGSGGSKVIHFFKAITLFGRNDQVADYCLSSPADTTTDLKYISRIHTRIIWTPGACTLVDSSLTGMYVNDIRIGGRVILQEGDTVTFGHPAGKSLIPGSHSRQPNSPFYFLFEHCDGCPGQMRSASAGGRGFSRPLKPPDSASAGVPHPGNPKLAFAHHVSRPQMAQPVVLRGHATLASPATQCDRHTPLAPPLTPASSPVTPPLLTPPRSWAFGGPGTSGRTRFSSPPWSPLSAPCRSAYRLLRSASPDYTVPEETSSVAAESPPLQENSESGDSASRSGSSGSTAECDAPNPPPLFRDVDARRDPERACVRPLLPGAACSEVSTAAGHGGSPNRAEVSGVWEETLAPFSPTEAGGCSGCAPSVFGPEVPALSETDDDEEPVEMNLGPSIEGTACHGAHLEPDDPVQGMEGAELAWTSARAAGGSVAGCRESLAEKRLPKAPSEETEGETSAEIGRSGGQRLNYERPPQGDPEHKAPPGEGDSEGKRSAVGASATASGDAAGQHREAEGGLARGPRGLAEQGKASHPAAGPSLARRPGPEPAERSPLGWAGGRADTSGDACEEGRTPRLGDRPLVETQLPSPKSQHEAGDRSGPDINHLLSSPCVTEEGKFVSLNGEDPVKAAVGEEEEEEEEARAGPVASVPLAGPKRDFGQSPEQVGWLKGDHRPAEALSEGPPCAINRQEYPADGAPQELKADGAESEGLESCPEVKPQGADVGDKRFSLEDSPAQSTACGPAAPVEEVGPPVRDGRGEGVLLAEESRGSARMAKHPHRSKARGSPLPSLPSVGLSQPGDPPVEPRGGSAAALETPDEDGDELPAHISAPEAGEEERRGTPLFGPAEQVIVNVTESSGTLGEPTGESTVGRPCDPATQEASAGLPKGAVALKVNLEGQAASHSCDHGSPARAAPPTAVAESAEPSFSTNAGEVALGGPSDGDREEGMALHPVHGAGQPANSPSESAEGARAVHLLCKDDGFRENTSQNSAGESWPLAGKPPGQPDTATVVSPLGEAVERLPGCEAPRCPCRGGGDCARNAGTGHRDIQRVPCQESGRQLRNGPGAPCSGGPRKAPLQEGEGLSSGSPPRKRHQSEELDWEGDQKTLRRKDFASVRGSARDPAASPALPPPPPPPPPPPDLKKTVEQFGKMIEKFPDRCENRTPRGSGPTERNGDAIAQVVRNYFKSSISSNEVTAENGRAGEREGPSPEGTPVKDVNGPSEEGAGGPGEGPGCDGPRSPEERAKDAQVPEEACVTPGGGSARPSEEEGKGSADAAQEVRSLEEDSFPFQAGSPPEDVICGFPADSPDSESMEMAFEDDRDTSSSLDTSASSQSHQSSPCTDWRRSDSNGGLSDWDVFLYGNSSDEEPWTHPGFYAYRRSDRPLSPSEQGSPGRWLQDGEPAGGDGPGDAASRKDPRKATEETAAEGDGSGRPTEGRVSPQGSPRGSPGQGNLQRAPAAGELLPQTPRGPVSEPLLQPGVGGGAPPLKRELADEESRGQGEGGNGPPPPSGRAPPPPPPLASAQGGGSPGGPSAPRRNPPPAGGAALLPVKADSVREDEAWQHRGTGSSLSALCPAQAGGPAGTGVRAGHGGSLEGGLCGGAGLAVSRQASLEAPRTPEEASRSFPATDVDGDQGACGVLPLQGDGPHPAHSPWADAAPGSRAFREEKKPLSPLRPYPTSSPPAPSVCRRSRVVPKASADEQPEGPSPRIPSESEEAEPSDAECLRVAAAVSCLSSPEFTERVSPFGDPPARTDSQSSCLRGRAGGRTPTGWAASEQDVAFQLQECQSVLAEVLQALSSVEGIDNACVEKWRDQVAALQKATKMPQTYIAVVGNTGAGKSCLLNALLDEEAMLPTPAMRACTAVAVEISGAAEGRPYEADVEFLSREEWDKELEALLGDMKDKAGILKKRCPDRKTEAGAAYSRVKAVYGRVDELEKLEDREGVTRHLGTVKHICAETAANFRVNIEKFIDSRTDHLREMKGGELWPIVKCVRIRVAKAEVLRTGAVLVDLPGIRDSNAARDTAAREYLKRCDAVWVTASIARAVDDKAAKEMLSAHFRRQLFMDGLYGSLAFLCTQTDRFSIADIVRDLGLQDRIRLLEEELRGLESQKIHAEVEKRRLYAQLREPEPAREGTAAADPAWLQRHDILEKEFKICALQREKEAKLRAISLICVQARNEFSKQRILRDFSAGLQEVSSRAEGEEDGEEEMEEGDPAGGQPVKLEVFTVSSVEYLKLAGKLLYNGQPQVFHDLKDTEIPALKKFAVDTALKHSMAATEKVIRDVACVLSQMVNYLNSQRTEADAHQAQVQEALQQALQDLPALLGGGPRCQLPGPPAGLSGPHPGQPAGGR